MDSILSPTFPFLCRLHTLILSFFFFSFIFLLCLCVCLLVCACSIECQKLCVYDDDCSLIPFCYCAVVHSTPARWAFVSTILFFFCLLSLLLLLLLLLLYFRSENKCWIEIMKTTTTTTVDQLNRNETHIFRISTIY